MCHLIRGITSRGTELIIHIYLFFPFFKIFLGRAFMPLLIYSRLTGSRERERWGRETAKIARLQCACWPTRPGLYHMAPMACGVADSTSEPGNRCHMSPFLSVYSILPIKAKKAERISKEKRGKKKVTRSGVESTMLQYIRANVVCGHTSGPAGAPIHNFFGGCCFHS